MKQYQNVTYDELLSYSQNNPNKSKSLDFIEIPIKEKTLDVIGLKGYKSFNLNPSGILSLLVCINDPLYYSIASPSARVQSIIDITTKLQEQTDELKNTSISRKRKKIRELISAVYNCAKLEEKDYLDLFHGINIMCNVQFILIKSAIQDNIEEGTVQNGIKGEIIFSSNPANWKSDMPVWIVDYHARWIAMSDKSSHNMIAVWLSDIEHTGWIIKWPEVDATKTELITHLSQLPTWQETDRKLTKDILSARLGRANCIKVFTSWMLSK